VKDKIVALVMTMGSTVAVAECGQLRSSLIPRELQQILTSSAEVVASMVVCC
jgi:hypothetical protein